MTIHEIKDINDVGDTTARISIDDGVLVLEHFAEPDPVVVGVIAEAPDLTLGVRACLQVGARALHAGHGALDEILVARSFEQIGERMETAVHAGVGLIQGLVDPDSKTSVLALIAEQLMTAIAESDESRWTQLDPDDERSALGRMRSAQSKEILDQRAEFKEKLDEVLHLIHQLQLTQAAEEAADRVFELTTLKGMVYEDVVHLAFSEACAPHSDVIEDVSRSRGASGSMVGDLVIALNPEENAGVVTAAVVEAKTKRMGQRKILAELDAAMANREATAAIAVFSSRQLAPIPSAFVPFGDKAIMVLDDDMPNMELVEVAMAWARYVARRASIPDTASFDHERFTAALGKAIRAAERASTIRRCHTTIRRSADQADAELEELISEVRAAVAELKAAAAE